MNAPCRRVEPAIALLAGYQVHVWKPIEPQELVAAIKSLAGNSRHRDP
jgi:CheY-like chemotaxis protein